MKREDHAAQHRWLKSSPSIGRYGAASNNCSPIYRTFIISLLMSGSISDREFDKHTPRNIVSEASYIVVSMAVSLFLVPYYIDELGMAAYAIVPLATSVTSYVMIFSDAFCSAINRYLIMSLEGDDADEANRTYSTSLSGLMRMMIIVMPVMAAVAYLSPYIFDITGSSADSVRVLFLLVLWSTIIVAVGSCFNYTMMAVNKLHFFNLTRVCYVVSQVAIVLVLFLFSEPRLEYIGAAYILASLIFAGLSYVLMKRNFPELRYDSGLASGVHLREILDLGFWSVVSRLSTLMFLQASLIIANICLGTVEGGNLSLIVNMVSMISTACMALFNIYNPYFYRSFAKGDAGHMVSMSVTGIRLTSILVAFPLAFICVYSSEVMTAWVGEEYSALSPVIWIMLSFLVMQSSINAVETVTVLSLRVKGLALGTMAFGILNIVLSVVLALFTDLGILGLALSYTLTMTMRSVLYYPKYVAQILDVNVRTLLVPQLEGMAAYLVSVAVLYAMSLLFTMPSTLLPIAVIFLIMFAIYLVVSVRATVKGADLEFVKNALPDALSSRIRR